MQGQKNSSNPCHLVRLASNKSKTCQGAETLVFKLETPCIKCKEYYQVLIFFSLISVALSLTEKSSNSGTDVKFIVSEGLIVRTGRTTKQTLFLIGYWQVIFILSNLFFTKTFSMVKKKKTTAIFGNSCSNSLT